MCFVTLRDLYTRNKQGMTQDDSSTSLRLDREFV